MWAFYRCNLLNAIVGLEQRKFFPSTDRKVNLIHKGQRLGANLHIDADRQLFLEIDAKRNNPRFGMNIEKTY